MTPLQQLGTLSPRTQDLFNLACVLHEDLSGGVLRDAYLRLLATRDGLVDVPKLFVEALREDIEALYRHRLLINRGPRYQATPELQGPQLRALAEAGTLMSYQVACAKELGHSVYGAYDDLLHYDVRLLRLEMINGTRTPSLKDLVEVESYNRSAYLTAVLSLCDSPFDERWRSSMPAELRAFALEQRPEDFQYPSLSFSFALNTLHQEQKLRPPLAIQLARLSAVGHPDAPDPLSLTGEARAEELELTALWGELLRRGASEALSARFMVALNAWRKVKRKRTALPISPEVVWLLLGYLSQADERECAALLGPVKAYAKQRGALYDERALLLEVTRFKALQGPRPAVNMHSWGALSLHSQAFRLVASRWLQLDLKVFDVPLLSSHLHQLQGLGWRLLELEAHNVMATLESEALTGELRATHAARVEELKSELKVSEVPSERLRAAPRWQESLAGITQLALGEKESSAEATSDERLVWVLWPAQHGYLDVEPRYQVYRGGRWSKGRAVALKRLYAEHSTLPFLSDQDRAVCGHIDEVYEQRGWRAQRSYALKLSALSELIDHPLVFVRNTQERLSISRAEASATVEPVEGGWSLSFSPQDVDAPLHLAWREGSLTIYELTETQRALIKRHPEPLIIPEEGTPELLKSLTALSRHLTLHSALPLGEMSLHSEGERSSTNESTTLSAQQLEPVIVLRVRREGDTLSLTVSHLSTPAGTELTPGEGALQVQVSGEAGEVLYVRDLNAERAALKRVEEALSRHATPEGDAGRAWRTTGLRESFELLSALQPLADELSLEWPEGEPLNLRTLSIDRRPNFVISGGQGGGWFEVQGELEVDEGVQVTLSDLLLGLRAGEGQFVRLSADQLLQLSEQAATKLRKLDALLATRDHEEPLTAHPALVAPLHQVLTEVGGTAPSAPKTWLKQAKRAEEAQSKRRYTPRGLKATLRPYQKEGFQWLSGLMDMGLGACLADDMGLGKTLQLIALLCQRKADGPSLVVAPTSLLAHWRGELARFAPELTARVLNDGADREALIEEVGASDVLICSYGLLVQSRESLSGRAWNILTFDEAQALKNSDTQRYHAASLLKAKGRVALSGTPIENRISELWSLFSLLIPGLLGDKQPFRERFELPINNGGAEERRAREALKTLTHPFILRRLKEDTLSDLPPKTEQVIKVRLSEGEGQLYEALRRDALEELDEAQAEGKALSHVEVFARLTRLRLAACHLSLVSDHLRGSDELRAHLERVDVSAKHKALKGLVAELISSGHRALIFSQFVKHLSLLRDWLDAEGISYQYLDGATPAKDRAARVEAFQEGEGSLFLISLRAGGVGLNLTGADYVIHMDPWWNPAVEDQATDRVHRIGQTRPVMVYRLIAEGTVEERILALHDHKRDLADRLLEGSESVTPLKVSELLALI